MLDGSSAASKTVGYGETVDKGRWSAAQHRGFFLHVERQNSSSELSHFEARNVVFSSPVMLESSPLGFAGASAVLP